MIKLCIKNFFIPIIIIVFVYFLDPLSLSPLAKTIDNFEGKKDIVNLGTSHGYSFVYTKVKNGLRFNKAANTLYYDLQNYLFLSKKNILNKNARVIIPISYFSFGLEENRTDLINREDFTNEFYMYLDKSQILNYSSLKYFRLHFLTAQNNFNNLFFNDNKLLNTITKNSQNDLRSHSSIQVQAEQKWVENSEKDGRIIRNFEYLRILITEIIKDGNTPIIVTPPFYYTYSLAYNKDWLNNNYFNRIYTIVKEFNLIYLDYSKDARFIYNPNFWKNSDHLNEIGSVVFSRNFFMDLDKCSLTVSNF